MELLAKDQVACLMLTMLNAKLDEDGDIVCTKCNNLNECCACESDEA